MTGMRPALFQAICLILLLLNGPGTGNRTWPPCVNFCPNSPRTVS